MSDNRFDYTTVSLDGPVVQSKRAITSAGIRRRHAVDGFDPAEFPKQVNETRSLLPGLSGRSGDRVYDFFWGMFTDLGGWQHSGVHLRGRRGVSRG